MISWGKLFSLTAALESQGGCDLNGHSVVATHHHSSVAMQNDHSYLLNYLGYLIAVHMAISQTSRFVFHVKQIVTCSASQVSTQKTFSRLSSFKQFAHAEQYPSNENRVEVKKAVGHV